MPLENVGFAVGEQPDQFPLDPDDFRALDLVAEEERLAVDEDGGFREPVENALQLESRRFS